MMRKVFGGMNMLSKRQQCMNAVHQYKEIFQCPICKSSMQLSELDQLQCENGHAFDIAKQGYVNLLQKPMQSMYSKELFEARFDVISSGLYDEVQQTIASKLTPGLVLDTGCGEGSHLTRIIAATNEDVYGVGIDIAKEGIVAAAKFNPGSIWTVGDLANSPFQVSSFETIINFLSPANYEEFKRLLAPGGQLIKIIPGEYYLTELRKQAFAGSNKESYNNEQTITRFRDQLSNVQVEHVKYTKALTPELAEKLVLMTPMGWHVEEKKQIELLEITIDLHILIGQLGNE